MNNEITRTRKHGTKVTAPANGQERIAAIRDILTNGYAKIDGVLVDSFSASAIVQVYDALNDANKELFSSKPAPTMARIAFKFVK